MIDCMPRPAAEQVRSARPTVAARQQFRRFGFAELHDLWAPAIAAAAADEASASYPEASDPTGGPRTPVAQHRATGIATRVATGPWLDELHRSLAPLARRLCGRLLVPAFANYGFFPEEDGVILHVDLDVSHVVLLFTALGSVGDLLVHPDLEGLAPRELGERASDPRWDEASGRPLRYPALGLTALRGSQLPHSRPSRPTPTLSAVAALHYCAPY